MEHVVFYQSTQGTPAFRRVASLEDAVSFAEHLRNVESVTEFSVFAMSPVTLSMRAYYHVEVSGDAAGAAQMPPPMPSSEPGVAAASFAAPPPDLPPTMPPPMEATSAPPPMSFNALEQEASAPHDELPPPPMASVPFAAAPLPPPSAMSPITETFVKDHPADLPPPADAIAEAGEPAVDPTTEEVVPDVPTGRRSMGFFARS